MEGVFEERAIHAFCLAITHKGLKEKLFHKKPTSMSKLMDITTEWASCEDALLVEEKKGSAKG